MSSLSAALGAQEQDAHVAEGLAWVKSPEQEVTIPSQAQVDVLAGPAAESLRHAQ